MHYARKIKRWGARFYDRHFRNFTFIHINKNGGRSIEKALGIPTEHRTALEKRAELGNAAWERRFCFAIVRNPWDRVVSQYFFRRAEGKNGLDTGDVPLTEWVRLVYKDRDPRYVDEPLVFEPQWNWMVDESGELILDFIGRFENLAADFAQVCSRIGVDTLLPHVNRTDHEHCREYYDERSIEIVRRYFAVDIEKFDYEF